MSKFLYRLYQTGLLKEENPNFEFGEPNFNAESPDEEPKAETTTLSPESEVLLIRLLKKAMVMKLDPEDIDEIVDLNDVNETNAKQVLDKIIRIMKSYSTEIDIDV